MSVPVSLDRLREEVDRFGPAAYLVTVNDDGRPHTTGVVVSWDGDRLVAGAGRRTRANATERPLIALLWSPYEPGGFALIVDGTATVDAAGDGDERVLVEPTHAVLHKVAAHCVDVL